MRLLFLSFCGVLFAGSGCVYYGPGSEYAVRPAVSQEDVRKMVQAGIGDDIIIAKIKSDGMTAKPSADDLVQLKEVGASEEVIEVMVSARVVTPVRRRVIYRSYPSASYYYDPWYSGWGYSSYGHHSYGHFGGHFGGHHGGHHGGHP